LRFVPSSSPFSYIPTCDPNQDLHFAQLGGIQHTTEYATLSAIGLWAAADKRAEHTFNVILQVIYRNHEQKIFFEKHRGRGCRCVNETIGNRRARARAEYLRYALDRLSQAAF
jgi:hypothetical protein